ncbi:MAG: methionine adenosyltransferase, partial [Thermomicrobiales bacterium]
MSTTFMQSPQLFFTSESVTEGHPDKLCDAISDAVLDAVMADDPMGRVACETATTTGLIMVFGEITTSPYVDVQALVRDVVREIGYDHSDTGFDCNTCGVVGAIKEQSREIGEGVEHALEVRAADGAGDAAAETGAGDQGMMVGFACNETPELMPLPIALAHALTRQLSVARRTKALPYLRPDGKSQVTIEYRFGKPHRVDAIVISTQHAPDVTNAQLEADLREHIIKTVVPAEMMDAQTKVYINPSGRFTIGGPMGDAGLTGRKIIVDTYGGMARHGGGAFSGKDCTKVDRS